ncbi:DUF982 domain-containing protein [Mesorhizobium sp. ES1-1]|uniref:DUF982 domain-containing protein n=1 Tax=Mesorhizobium sp. ES1-1 TaxID=2876629 RepID=UPI001CD01E6B|nr:DUF982 domain-containing protein [Mesorhizobium sp. ES1-1]MBZ9676003.1 DUF982 domain-containing protein [Mesorhizobium sp. ES1-1]
MNDRMFDSPVIVRSGGSLGQEIVSLHDALEFPSLWPKERRGVIYETALRACRRAFDGGYPLSAARDAFCGFAKSARIYEDMSAALPWAIPENRSRGGGLVA